MDAKSYYRQNSVETATPGQLVSMLYHGAVAAIAGGANHVDAGDLDSANRELQRAQDIVTELRRTLDFERGNPIAANLDALYDFCIDRLVKGNIRKDVILLEEARSTLAGLSVTWDEMLATQTAVPSGTPVGAVG